MGSCSPEPCFLPMRVCRASCSLWSLWNVAQMLPHDDLFEVPAPPIETCACCDELAVGQDSVCWRHDESSPATLA